MGWALPFTVFFLTSFFRTLPSSVAEAALIDGASHTRTFFQVMLPMAKPGLISVGIFNFLGQWNQYLLPTVLNTNDPVGHGGWMTLSRSQRQSSPIFMVWRPFSHVSESAISVTPVLKSDAVLVGDPIC